MTHYLFFILSFITIVSALMVVFNRNPIHSVMYLIVCFFSITGHYVLLNAQFIGVINIIVYTGAIMVLMLFVIMLLNLNKTNELQKSNLLKITAVIAGGLLGVVIVGLLKDATPVMNANVQAPEQGYIKAIGQKLFNDYLLPFEVASVLLLSAMVGVVLISKKQKNQEVDEQFNG